MTKTERARMLIHGPRRKGGRKRLRRVSRGNGHLPSCWPMTSEALGVHISQIQEATKDARAKGVPTEFDRSGRPIFTDRGHRRAYMRAYGYYDKAGGYSDAGRHDFRGERPKVDPSLYDYSDSGRSVDVELVKHLQRKFQRR